MKASPGWRGGVGRTAFCLPDETYSWQAVWLMLFFFCLCVCPQMFIGGGLSSRDFFQSSISGIVKLSAFFSSLGLRAFLRRDEWAVRALL